MSSVQNARSVRRIADVPDGSKSAGLSVARLLPIFPSGHPQGHSADLKGAIPEIQVHAAVCTQMAGILLNQKRLCVDPFMKMNGTRRDILRSRAKVTLARRFRRAHASRAISQELTEKATMSRVKQASKQNSTTKAAALKVLGAAGLSFSLVGSASASTMPTAGIPQSDNTSPNQRFVLSEEEMIDVSLATFYVFDRENVGSGVREARGCGGCGRGGGCGGCRGCGGGGFRGCGGVGFGGCRGCGGGCGCGGCGFGGFWFGGCGGCAGCAIGGGCCGSWGACRLC
jgi:hypothetical protein